MQNKPCPHNNTKLHYYDDEFEYHHGDESQMTQLIFDNLKSLKMIFGIRQIDCIDGDNSFVLYERNNPQWHIRFYITYIHNIYIVYVMYPIIIEYKFDTIDKVHNYLDKHYPELRKNSYTQKIVIREHEE